MSQRRKNQTSIDILQNSHASSSQSSIQNINDKKSLGSWKRLLLISSLLISVLLIWYFSKYIPFPSLLFLSKSSSEIDSKESLTSNINDDDDDSLIYNKNKITKEMIQDTIHDVHIVFTTGCSDFQNWQSEVLLYSWAIIQHPGKITRIVAGCKNSNEINKANKTGIISDRVHFYFVPDYTPKTDGPYRPFHYFNKPYGFNQWLSDDKNNNVIESVIVLIDPDMIILRPFLFHMKSAVINDYGDDKLYVYEGHPISQKYGIGPKWIHWKICKEPLCNQINERDAWNYYSVGPPYILHINDWKKIAPKWVEYSPLALEKEPPPSILAEMYSFSLASGHYNIKYNYLLSMVSDTGGNIAFGEYWDGITWNETEKSKLHILHYCQGYYLGENKNTGTIRLGGWNWHKGHVPKTIRDDCNIPLFIEPPINQRTKLRDSSNQKRHLWMLSTIYKYVNQAIGNFKLKYCPNWKPEYKLVLQQPESDPGRNKMNYLIDEYENGPSWAGA